MYRRQLTVGNTFWPYTETNTEIRWKEPKYREGTYSLAIDAMVSFCNEVEVQIGNFLELWAISIHPVCLKVIS